MEPDLAQAGALGMVMSWREIIRMRSVITHGYDQVDNQELWQVIERDLPDLMPKIEAILARIP